MAQRTLTDLTLRTLKVGSGERIEVWDERLPGFGVRVSGSGAKSFVLLFRRGGRAHRMTLGRYPVLSLAEARAKALDALNKLAHDEDPRPTSAAPRGVLSFAEAVEQFLERYAAQHTRPSSQAQSARVLRKHFGGEWSDRDIGNITKHDIQSVLDGLVQSGRPIAANNARAVAGRFFSWCVERGLIEQSPSAGVRRPARAASRERVLSESELAAVVRTAQTLGFPFGTIVLLLVLTGQRRNEVAGMRWSGVDLEERVWHLPPEATKNHRAHSLPLSRFACDIILGVPRVDDDLVFPSLRGNGRSFSGFGRAKARLDRAAELGDWTLHDLRRTTATHMARLGVAPHVVERVLNHVSGTMSGVARVYNRFGYLPEMRAALELWATHVEKLVGDAGGATS